MKRKERQYTPRIQMDRRDSCERKDVTGEPIIVRGVPILQVLYGSSCRCKEINFYTYHFPLLPLFFSPFKSVLLG